MDSLHTILVLTMVGFDASLSNKSEQKLRSLNLHVGGLLTTRGLYSRYSTYLQLKWIPYQEKGHYNRKLELKLVCSSSVSWLGILLQEPYFSETLGFFAVILD